MSKSFWIFININYIISFHYFKIILLLAKISYNQFVFFNLEKLDPKTTRHYYPAS